MGVSFASMRSIRTVFGDACFSLYLLKMKTKPERGDSVTSVPHFHPFYELHAACGGDYAFRFPDRTVTLQKGEALLIPPGCRHYSVTPSPSYYLNDVLMLSVRRTEGDVKIYDDFLRVASQPGKYRMTEETSRLIGEFYHNGQRTAREKLYAGVLAARLVFGLLDMLGIMDGTEKSAKEDPPREEESRMLLDELLNRGDLSLSLIAELMHFSPRHTARIIRESYGMSLTALRKKRMLDTAAELLGEQPDMPIRTVYEAAGFKNDSVFRAAFRQTYGCTPSEYREKTRNENAADDGKREEE